MRRKALRLLVGYFGVFVFLCCLAQLYIGVTQRQGRQLTVKREPEVNSPGTQSPLDPLVMYEPDNADSAIREVRKEVIVEQREPEPHREVINTSDLDPSFIFEDSDMLDEHHQPYTIMIWSRYHGKPGYLANPEVCQSNVSCDVISGNSLTDPSPHAVVFNGGSAVTQDLTSQRKPHQLFTWWEQESPLHGSGPKEPHEYFYNLTFHYRLDADIYAPYGSIHLILDEIRKANDDDVDDLMARKSDPNKVAVWAVSNCYSRRKDYAMSLKNAGLNIDLYGRCFGDRKIGGGRYSESFYQEISKYKFYLSFENSITCKDYITEKFWFNGLRAGAIPVVWGPRKEDILKVAPSHSFIHADDFKTPADLVNYLNYLDSNDAEYRKYLEWREWARHPTRIEEHLKLKYFKNNLRSFCLLCAIIQQHGRARKRGQVPERRQIQSAPKEWRGREESCHH